jgi:ribonuclease Y
VAKNNAGMESGAGGPLEQEGRPGASLTGDIARAAGDSIVSVRKIPDPASSVALAAPLSGPVNATDRSHQPGPSAGGRIDTARPPEKKGGGGPAQLSDEANSETSTALSGIQSKLEEQLAVIAAEYRRLQHERGELYKVAASYAAEFRREQERLAEERRRLEEERKTFYLQAKQYADEWQRELADRRQEWEEQKKRHAEIEKHLAERERRLAEREERVALEEARVQKLIGQATEHLEVYKASLERLAGMSRAEAIEELKKEVIEEAKEQATAFLSELEARVREEGKTRAWKILTTAMQRIKSEVVEKEATCEVRLPSEEFKGRIVGKDGRNIRAFEAVTGVELDLEDSNEAVIVSSHDPIRREKARVCLELLVEDGRIQPSRIEDAYERASRIVDLEMYQAGEEAVQEFGFTDMSREIIDALGRLKYVSSYGQNVLAHLRETARIAWAIAEELGMDPKIAARGALLHDIGKALVAGSGGHARAGAEFALRHGESAAVAHCIEAHHEEVPPRTVEAVLVQVADHLSGGRPGARRGAPGSSQYAERLAEIEQFCRAFDGVREAYAFKAGREIRVVVDPYRVKDQEAIMLARDITQALQSQRRIFGAFKVIVLRELRVEEHGGVDAKA